MRYVLLCALCAFATKPVTAQIPVGHYTRSIAMGHAGEAIEIKSDGIFIRHEWIDVSIENSPSSVYLGESGVFTQTQDTIKLRYEQVRFDTLGIKENRRWRVPIEEWSQMVLNSAKVQWPVLLVRQIKGKTVLVWPDHEAHVRLCEKALAWPEPEDVLEALDWTFSREEACGWVFLPQDLMTEVWSG